MPVFSSDSLGSTLVSLDGTLVSLDGTLVSLESTLVSLSPLLSVLRARWARLLSKTLVCCVREEKDPA
jgi:hypothetical protein